MSEQAGLEGTKGESSVITAEAEPLVEPGSSPGENNAAGTEDDDVSLLGNAVKNLDEGAKHPDGPEGGGAEAVVPEHYSIKLPEGIELDQEGFEELEPLLKKARVSEDVAQELVDLYIKRVEASQNAAKAMMGNVVRQWQEQVKADPEIGGGKLQESLGLSAKVLSKFGSKAAIDVLNDSGLGNHPEVIRMLAKIGRVISQDKFIEPSPGAHKASNLAEETAKVLFPNSLRD